MQKVLCRFRWDTSAPNLPGAAMPTRALRLAPSTYTWPPCSWTIRQTSGPDWFQLANFVDTNNRSGGTRVNNDNRTWITEVQSASLNARWAVPFMERFPTSLKFGGKISAEDRNNNIVSDWDIWSYTGPGGNTVAVSPTNGANINTEIIQEQSVITGGIPASGTNAFDRNVSGKSQISPAVLAVSGFGM